jgi:hypothetical protein
MRLALSVVVAAVLAAVVAGTALTERCGTEASLPGQLVGSQPPGELKYSPNQLADSVSVSASSSVSFWLGCTIISAGPHDECPICRPDFAMYLYRATLFPS